MDTIEIGFGTREIAVLTDGVPRTSAIALHTSVDKPRKNRPTDLTQFVGVRTGRFSMEHISLYAVADVHVSFLLLFFRHML